MLSENLGLKVFSLLLAVFVWIQSLLVSEHRTVVNLQVSLKNVPKNITLERLPKSIPFSVRAKGLDIIKLKLSKTRVFIDASKVKPGVDIISLTDYTIDLPENIDVNLLGPVDKQEIAINADVFYQRKVPVQLSFSDDYTRQRMKSTSYQIVPEKTVIFGPKNKVQKINFVTTEPITRDMNSEIDFKLKLASLPDGVSIADTEVRVRISNSYNTIRIFDSIPLAPSSGSLYFPPSVAVKVSGDSKLLKELDSRRIIIEVSPEADADGFYTLRGEAPAGFDVVAVTPEKVRKK
ncbi:MAG: hypothetical protein PHO32_10395 [Candidatus Cloacimonetes bacterium]|nr:hypothetical protein [Candidatus Cloacimonadota bacterium]